MSAAGEREDLFWKLIQPRLTAGTVQRGTLMGRPCVRVGDEFAAMPHSKTGALIVKLPADRVRTLIADGVGEPFGPGERVFKEWLAVPEADEGVWGGLIEEALGSAAEAGR